MIYYVLGGRLAMIYYVLGGRLTMIYYVLRGSADDDLLFLRGRLTMIKFAQPKSLNLNHCRLPKNRRRIFKEQMITEFGEKYR